MPTFDRLKDLRLMSEVDTFAMKVARGSKHNIDALREEMESLEFDGKAQSDQTMLVLDVRDSEVGPDGLYSLKDENGTEYERVFYFVTHLALCDLWDLTQGLTMPSEIAHHYTYQLNYAVYCLNQKCVSHHDIKPENTLVRETYDLWLCDLGLLQD